ncbi:TonB-dependent siderophore receptor [Vibrio sp. ZSDE26]|uniref:TonB-dependent siderophore receptor n=1 Tax=Vibrio amylolyticus TaxID=2847292 RepID=A0A9X1XPL9_9VIBR|nr:TonB-dependent siderophore receptor [Vibrio amylolyticus]MCK6265848.1 TonB-dependent siderophore receptor [Vibrio amylolyticus]
MEKFQFYPQRKSLVSLAIGLALSNTALAEDVYHLEEVVVWGTKVSSSSESIGADDMSLKQADHMSDLLRDIPGVDVGGTHSLNQRINIRGLNETNLDIRLDGASQHANMFHHIGNLTLNPDILKSVDIQVGNNSVTQGGLGGAVYFETKNATDLLRYGETFGARVFGGYASNDSQQGSMTVYGMLGEKVDAMVYGHLVSRDNFKDGNGDESFGAAGDVYNVMAKFGFEPSENHRFEFAYDLYNDEGDYNPRPDLNGNANEEISGELLLPTVYKRNTVTLSYKLDTEQHKGKVALYSTETEIERDESQTGWARHQRESVNTANNNNTGLNATFQSDFVVADLDTELTYGLDYMDKSSSSAYGGVEFMDESAISTAVFVEEKVYLVDSWSVTGGLRYDDYQRKAETGTHDFDELTWSLGTHWDINKNWAVFANSRSLFKGPELLETFVRYQDVTYLADDIKAETGLNSQAGFSYNNREGQHRYGVNFTAFQTNIDDYIVETWASDYSTLAMENSGDIEIRGFELSTTYGYEQLAAKLSYSKSDSKYTDSGLPVDDGNGRSLDVGDSIAVTLDYHSDSLNTLFGWTSIVVLEEDNVFEGNDVKESYNVHNLYAQWLPSQIDNLSVTFGIDNLFDEAYVSHASRSGTAGRNATQTDDYEPGRNYKLSAAYQF